MYTDRLKKTKTQLFSRNLGIDSIKEYIQVKIYNPSHLEFLKQKQLKIVKLRNLKIKQDDLKFELRKRKMNLESLVRMKKQIEMKEFNKDKQLKKVKDDLQRKGNLVNTLKEMRKKKKQEIYLQVQQIEINLLKEKGQIIKKIKDEQSEFIHQNQKRKNTLQNLIKLNVQIKQTKIKKSMQIEGKKSAIFKFKLILDSKKQNIKHLNQKKKKIQYQIKIIEAKKVQKIQIFRQKRKKVQSVERNSEKQSIKKLKAFVHQLKIILENTNSPIQEQTNLCQILLNAYTQHDQPITNIKSTHSISFPILQTNSLICIPLEKHQSIQTNLSFQSFDENRSSKKQNHSYRDSFSDAESLKIPYIMLDSLKQMQKQAEIQYLEDIQIKKSSRLSGIKRIQSLEEGSLKNQESRYKQRQGERNSLPTELSRNNIGLQEVDQQMKIERQMAVIQQRFDNMDRKQTFMDRQIEQLREKCGRKEKEIKEIEEQLKMRKSMKGKRR